MIPYLLWLWLTWRCGALKCRVKSKLKSSKVTQVWQVTQFFLCWWSEFPNVSLVVMHSNMNINMDSNKRVHKQTNNKQTSMYAWAFKNRTQTIYSHRTFTHVFVKDNKQMKWQGFDLHGYPMFIVTGIFDFINVHWFQLMIRAQYRVDDPSACTTASCCWWADQLRTKDITPYKRLTLHDHWC